MLSFRRKKQKTNADRSYRVLEPVQKIVASRPYAGTVVRGVYDPSELNHVQRAIKAGEYDSFQRVNFWLECHEFDKEEGYGVGLLYILCSNPSGYASGKHGYGSLDEALQFLSTYLT